MKYVILCRDTGLIVRDWQSSDRNRILGLCAGLNSKAIGKPYTVATIGAKVKGKVTC